MTEPLAKVTRRLHPSGVELYTVECDGAPVSLVNGDVASANANARIINLAVFAHEKALWDRIAELEKEKQVATESALELVRSGLCDRHSKESSSLSFQDFKENVCVCPICLRERIEQLEKELREAKGGNK